MMTSDSNKMQHQNMDEMRETAVHFFFYINFFCIYYTRKTKQLPIVIRNKTCSFCFVLREVMEYNKYKAGKANLLDRNKVCLLSGGVHATTVLRMVR